MNEARKEDIYRKLKSADEKIVKLDEEIQRLSEMLDGLDQELSSLWQWYYDKIDPQSK